MNLPALNLTLEMIAGYAASEYVNTHTRDLPLPERLATWKRVSDTLIAALTYQRDMLKAREREVLHHVSPN